VTGGIRRGGDRERGSACGGHYGASYCSKIWGLHAGKKDGGNEAKERVCEFLRVSSVVIRELGLFLFRQQ